MDSNAEETQNGGNGNSKEKKDKKQLNSVQKAFGSIGITCIIVAPVFCLLMLTLELMQNCYSLWWGGDAVSRVTILS